MPSASSSSTEDNASRTGFVPAQPAAVHQHNRMAVFRNELGMMLDNDDGFAVLFIQAAQDVVDLTGMLRIKLSNLLRQ